MQGFNYCLFSLGGVAEKKFVQMVKQPSNLGQLPLTAKSKLSDSFLPPAIRDQLCLIVVPTPFCRSRSQHSPDARLLLLHSNGVNRRDWPSGQVNPSWPWRRSWAGRGRDVSKLAMWAIWTFVEKPKIPKTSFLRYVAQTYPVPSALRPSKEVISELMLRWSETKCNKSRRIFCRIDAAAKPHPATSSAY